VGDSFDHSEGLVDPVELLVAQVVVEQLMVVVADRGDQPGVEMDLDVVAAG
jgi:hypothetical protein